MLVQNARHILQKNLDFIALSLAGGDARILLELGGLKLSGSRWSDQNWARVRKILFRAGSRRPSTDGGKSVSSATRTAPDKIMKADVP